MQKKILLLVTTLLVMTGCSATYDLEIYNNTIKEDFKYINLAPETWDSPIQYGLSYRALLQASIEYPYPAFDSTVVDENDRMKLDGVEYYDNKLISTSDRLGQSLSYHKFKLDNFNDSSIVKKCYQYFNVMENENNIILSTSLENLCFEEYPSLDDITIHLKTNHKVVDSNADTVDGYHYTWNITRENKDNAGISITIKKNEYIFNYENEFIKKIIYIGAIIGIILVVSLSIYIKIRNENRKMNEI